MAEPTLHSQLPVEPLVSVVIPTKNRPERLFIAVASVLEQTYANLEVIVVDDGSNPPVQLPFDDQRLKLIRRPHSGGGAVARNQGLAAAKGEYLCLLDDDDYYYPDKIEVQLTYLQAHPQTDLVFSKVRVIDPWGRSRFYLSDVYLHSTYLNFRYFNVIHTNATLFRRRLWEKVRFDERLTKYQDMQFHLATCLHGRVEYLPRTVAVWQQWAHRDQVSRRLNRKNYRNFERVCEIFKVTIQASPSLRRRYYGRLGFQAIRCFDLIGATKYLWRMTG